MIHKLIQTSPILLVLSLLAPALVPDRAYAIPAFTRTHKVECTTCHTIFPELNEYGDAFLKNSYVYVGKGKKGAKEAETPPPMTPTAAPKTVTVAKPAAAAIGSMSAIQGDGDDELLRKLKGGALTATETAEPAEAPVAEPVPAAAAAPQPVGEQKPEGLLLSAIPEQLPISFTGSLNINYDNRAVNEFDFSTRAFKLHAGGNFRDTVGFFATYVAYSEQPPASSGNTSVISSNNKTDLTEFFISWRQFLNTPVNLKVGRMPVSYTHLTLPTIYSV